MNKFQVNLWNMETQQSEHRTEEHSNFITDIRFRVGAAQLATSSSDGTVKLWNAAEVMIFTVGFILFER